MLHRQLHPWQPPTRAYLATAEAWASRQLTLALGDRRTLRLAAIQDESCQEKASISAQWPLVSSQRLLSPSWCSTRRAFHAGRVLQSADAEPPSAKLQSADGVNPSAKRHSSSSTQGIRAAEALADQAFGDTALEDKRPDLQDESALAAGPLTRTQAKAREQKSTRRAMRPQRNFERSHRGESQRAEADLSAHSNHEAHGESETTGSVAATGHTIRREMTGAEKLTPAAGSLEGEEAKTRTQKLRKRTLRGMLRSAKKRPASDQEVEDSMGTRASGEASPEPEAAAAASGSMTSASSLQKSKTPASQRKRHEGRPLKMIKVQSLTLRRWRVAPKQQMSANSAVGFTVRKVDSDSPKKLNLVDPRPKSTPEGRPESKSFTPGVGSTLIGTILTSKPVIAGLSLRRTLDPLEPSWYRGQTVQHVLFLFTPAFAWRLRAGDGFIFPLLQRMFQRNHNAGWHGKIKVALAVVDRLPASQGFLFDRGKAITTLNGGSCLYSEDNGYEGMAYALVDDITAVDAAGDRDLGGGRCLNLRIESHERPASSKVDGETGSNSYEVQIPLANTVFQIGVEDLLATLDYQFKPKEKEGDRSYGPKFVARNDAISSLTATLRLKTDPDSLVAGFFTPLRPLTESRQVEASMGNIIRQLRRRDEEVFPASSELEAAVNSMVANSTLPASPVAVWALIVKKDLHSKLAGHGISFPQLSRSEEVLDGATALQDLDPDSSDLPSSDDRGSQPRYPDLTDILRLGGRLHRVMSGGGGWGKKAGLLSISPAVNFDQASPNLPTSGWPPWASEPEEMSQALGSPVEPGDHIQFFLAEPQAKDPSSKAYPTRNMGRDMGPDMGPFILNIGTIPSTVDAIPDGTSVSTEGEICESKLLPNQFGVLSEKGFSISRANLQASPPVVSSQTVVDVPYSRFSLYYGATAEVQEAAEPSEAAPEGQSRGFSIRNVGATPFKMNEIRAGGSDGSAEQNQRDPTIRRYARKEPGVIEERQDGSVIRMVPMSEPAQGLGKPAEGTAAAERERPQIDWFKPSVDNNPERSLVRKVSKELRDGHAPIRYHIKSREDPQSAAIYRRAVAKDKMKKLEQEAAAREQRKKALRETIKESGVLEEVLDIATGKKKTGQTKEFTSTEEPDRPKESGTATIRPLSNDQKAYTEELETLSNEELEQEKKDLDAALIEARTARKQASSAIDRMQMPSWTHDLKLPAQWPTEKSKPFSVMTLPNIQKLRNMSFDELSAHFLELKSGVKHSHSDVAKDKFWADHGFPPALVDMLSEYHDLKPQIPEEALSVFGKSYEGLLELPFAQLRAAAKKLPPEKERQFWRKWQLLRRMGNVMKAQARTEFKELLKKRADLEVAAAKTETEVANATQADAVRDIDSSFRLMLFRVLGKSMRVTFHQKHHFWFTSGLPLATRSQLWRRPATGKLLQALMTWLMRLNYSTGDAVGAALSESIAWNSTFNKSARFGRLKSTTPKLLIKYDSGDADEFLNGAEGVKLLHKPYLRSGHKLISEEEWRSLSEKSPWEFLYRFLTFWDGGEIPEAIMEKRSPDNKWRVKLAFKPIRDKLGPVFQKFDDAINAHGDNPGPVEVDIGTEIREHFPALLRPEADLRRDMGMDTAKFIKVPTEDYRDRQRMRLSNVSLRRVKSKGQTLYRSVRFGVGRTPSSGFVSGWRTNPNQFAFEIMEKRMRARVQQRLKERLALRGKNVTPAAPPEKQEKAEEDDDERDIDYDLVERAIERKLDRRGIRQPTVKRLELDTAAQKDSSASTAAGAADQGFIPWSTDFPADVEQDVTPRTNDAVANAASDGIPWASDSPIDSSLSFVPRRNDPVVDTGPGAVPWPDIPAQKQRWTAQPVKHLNLPKTENSGAEPWPETIRETMVSAAQDVHEARDVHAAPSSSAPLSWRDSSAPSPRDRALISKKSGKSARLPPPPPPPHPLTKGERRRRRARDKKGMAKEEKKKISTGDPLIKRVESERQGKKTDDELQNEKEKLRTSILKLLGRL